MFLATDCGCYIDDSRGHAQIRMVMGNILATLYRHHPRGGPGLYWSEVEPIITALDGEMSYDAWEEDEALAWLNKQ